MPRKIGKDAGLQAAWYVQPNRKAVKVPLLTLLFKGFSWSLRSKLQGVESAGMPCFRQQGCSTEPQSGEGSPLDAAFLRL